MDSTTQDACTIATDTLSSIERLGVAATGPCYLLDIAAELRNEIYELAFAVDETEVDLINDKPPSVALLQCCKQIHEEAEGIFQATVRQYYDTKQFRLTLDQSDAPFIKLDQITSRFAFQRMRNLQFEASYKSIGSARVAKLVMQTDRLVWHFTNPGLGSPYYMVMLALANRRGHCLKVLGESEAQRAEQLNSILNSPRGERVVFTVKGQVEEFVQALMGLRR